MSINITLREIITSILFFGTIIAGLLYYIYQKDNTVSIDTLKEYKIELNNLKVNYKEGLNKLEDMRDRDKKLFLDKIDAMGVSQAIILEKIYQQSLVSSKSVDEVRIQMAKASSANLVMSDKMDRVLVRMVSYERKSDQQEKKIIELQNDVTAISKFLEKISKDKGFSFFKVEY